MERFKKNCPYCGEEIMASAKKCRHCGEWLEQSYNDVPNNSSEIDYSNMSVNRYHNITKPLPCKAYRAIFGVLSNLITLFSAYLRILHNG